MHIGRKSKTQRLLDTIDQSLQVANDVRPALSHLAPLRLLDTEGRGTMSSIRATLHRRRSERANDDS